MTRTYSSYSLYRWWFDVDWSFDGWSFGKTSHSPIKRLSAHQCDDTVHDTIISQKPP